MDLTPYVGALGRELLDAVETGAADATTVIERLTATMEPAIRLTLLEALSAAADEITHDLAPGSVQVRLRGRDPDFVVTAPHVPQEPDDPPARDARPADETAASFEEGPSVRINVRLPEQLKAAAEEAAAKEGRSLNAWLVRAASSALHGPARGRTADRHNQYGPQHHTGWVRQR
ncbi:YlcI/YnfO family protein [Kutzneria buriramensis]|uniref:HicB-like protein involved in pilus formation n=1 Tax=Kutzneria buriramensis TaxID=1045776 RepID=A0A3E0HKB3_9PSEU|nr:YlcI/YnfO family protein [Kutzneria buriramensis]REH46912.1 HicB-like protein involved in pilus formation [Kutzneria buriramensis]